VKPTSNKKNRGGGGVSWATGGVVEWKNNKNTARVGAKQRENMRGAREASIGQCRCESRPVLQEAQAQAQAQFGGVDSRGREEGREVQRGRIVDDAILYANSRPKEGCQEVFEHARKE